MISATIFLNSSSLSIVNCEVLECTRNEGALQFGLAMSDTMFTLCPEMLTEITEPASGVGVTRGGVSDCEVVEVCGGTVTAVVGSTTTFVGSTTGIA